MTKVTSGFTALLLTFVATTLLITTQAQAQESPCPDWTPQQVEEDPFGDWDNDGIPNIEDEQPCGPPSTTTTTQPTTTTTQPTTTTEGPTTTAQPTTTAARATRTFYVCNIPANDPDGGLVVRSAPSSSSSNLGVLPSGTAVTAYTTLNAGWIETISPISGWVNSRYLCNQPEASTTTTTQPTTTTTFENPCPDYQVEQTEQDPFGDWDNDGISNIEDETPCGEDTIETTVVENPNPCPDWTQTDAERDPFGDWDNDGIPNIEDETPCGEEVRTPCPEFTDGQLEGDPNGDWDNDGISNSEDEEPCDPTPSNPCDNPSDEALVNDPNGDWDNDGIPNSEDDEPCVVNVVDEPCKKVLGICLKDLIWIIGGPIVGIGILVSIKTVKGGGSGVADPIKDGNGDGGNTGSGPLDPTGSTTTAIATTATALGTVGTVATAIKNNNENDDDDGEREFEIISGVTTACNTDGTVDITFQVESKPASILQNANKPEIVLVIKDTKINPYGYPYDIDLGAAPIDKATGQATFKGVQGIGTRFVGSLRTWYTVKIGPGTGNLATITYDSFSAPLPKCELGDAVTTGSTDNGGQERIGTNDTKVDETAFGQSVKSTKSNTDVIIITGTSPNATKSNDDIEITGNEGSIESPDSDAERNDDDDDKDRPRGTIVGGMD